MASTMTTQSNTPAPLGDTVPAATQIPQKTGFSLILPEGVSVVSFADYQPVGIILPASRDASSGEGEEEGNAAADDIEVDGTGVPTVQLETTHDPITVPTEDLDEMRAKSREQAAMRQAQKGRWYKKKKLADSREGGPIMKKGDDEVSWWEKWALEEQKKQGKKIVTYNMNDDRAERLELAVKVFRKGHAMDADLQSLWDKWTDFIGLLPYEQRFSPPDKDGIKRARGISPLYDDDTVKETEQTWREEREERLIQFLEDPTKAIKRFFSSRYHFEGLYWDESSLRDGPLLVSIFLRYLLQENVIPEYAIDVTSALTLLEEVIKPDLPAALAFNIGIEDAFSQACYKELGVMVLRDGRGRWKPAKEVEAKRNAERDEAQRSREEERKKQEEERKKHEAEQKNMPVDYFEAETWGSGKMSLPDGVSDWATLVSWDTNEVKEGAPASSATTTATTTTEKATPTGQLNIADSYSLLRTESSIRRVVSVRAANPNSSDPLRQKYATIIFEPWSVPEDAKDTDFLCPPEMLIEATGEKECVLMYMPGGKHSLEDRIELLVDTEHAKKARKGLGVHAVWVQAGKMGDMSGAGVEDGKGDRAETFWFFQQVTLVIPSYWTE